MSRAAETSKEKTKLPRRWGLFKFLAFAALLCFAALIGGFLKFMYMITQPSVPSPVPQADGVVVWTGRGGGRLAAATNLLEKGKGERLLISGVNAQNSREDIKALLSISDELDACCVDLDYAAEDTIGNARETAIWAEALGFEHVILVTSAYHMPRAKVEIRSAVGPIRITPYPVVSDENGPWWKDRKQFTRYAQEYGKLLSSLIREPRKSRSEHAPIIEDDGALVPEEKITSKDNTP